jgi:hypothetical protein
MSAGTAEIFWSDSETKAINTGIRFEHLATVAWRFFIFRVLLENSAFVVSDIVARDLVSSYFRFP